MNKITELKLSAFFIILSIPFILSITRVSVQYNFGPAH